MPDKRSHRRPHPDDVRLFAPDHWPARSTIITRYLPTATIVPLNE